MLKSYYLAKVLKKIRFSSFNKCQIDSTAKVDYDCTLSNVTLGRYSYIGSGTRITDAVIGNFCSIGGKCGIGGGIHPTDLVSTSPVFLKGHNILGKNFSKISYNPSETVEIGNDVWIGEGVCILSGVKIGDGAIIGAHAVVTHDIDSYSVVAGVPAKLIRKRFDEKTVNKLLQLEWWHWSDEKIEQNSCYFADVKTFIKETEK